MITANTNKSREFNIAFTFRKELPEDFLLHRKETIKLKAKINKKDTNIEVFDFLPQAFDGLPLLNFLIKTGTDLTAEEVQKGLVKRYGNAVKNTVIYIILYKKVK